MRGATAVEAADIAGTIFQSTLLMRGATSVGGDFARLLDDFNPRSSCEERLNHNCMTNGIFISIHAPHARSDSPFFRFKTINDISIHAPHARSDYPLEPADGVVVISIHAPHARSDSVLVKISAVIAISIHAPHARSDDRCRDWAALPRSISIHAPHARSDMRLYEIGFAYTISIHAPHARSDLLSVTVTP